MAVTEYFIPGNTSQSLTEKNDQVDLLCSVLKFLSIDFKRKKKPYKFSQYQVHSSHKVRSGVEKLFFSVYWEKAN